MVMETFLPFSQNTLKFLIKSRRRAFLYPSTCEKSAHRAHYSAGPSARVRKHSRRAHTRFIKGKKIHIFILVNSQLNHLGELQILAAETL